MKILGAKIAILILYIDNILLTSVFSNKDEKNWLFHMIDMKDIDEALKIVSIKIIREIVQRRLNWF